MTEQQKPPATNLPAVQKKDTLADLIVSRRDAFAMVATRYLDPDRLVKLAQVVITRIPELGTCSKLSVLECLMTCARLGLEPHEPGGIWLVPFKGVCTKIIDYRGMIDVCRRSGEIKAVHTDVHCEHDKFSYVIDTTGDQLVQLRHEPKRDGDRGKVLGVYFAAALKSGGCQAVYLTRQQIDDTMNRSAAVRSGRNTPWKTDWEAMAKKTAVRRGVNLLPKTPETQQLLSELSREDEDDVIDVLPVDMPEANTEAVERMIAEVDDKAVAQAILGGFEQLGYGPARRVQLLTQFVGDPKGLQDYLQHEWEKKNPPAVPATPAAAATPPAAQTAPATTKKPGKGKNKGKGSKSSPAKPEPAQPPAEPKAQQPAAPKPEPVKFEGGSF